MNNWLNEATQEFERRTNLTDVQYKTWQEIRKIGAEL